MNVSVIVPPASIASTRGSRPLTAFGTSTPPALRTAPRPRPQENCPVVQVARPRTDTDFQPCPYPQTDETPSPRGRPRGAGRPRRGGWAGGPPGARGGAGAAL